MSTKPQIDDLHHQLFEEGLKVRRAVLGDEYVDRALQNASSFSWPGQELITEWAWGNIWTRPGLDRKQCSLLSKRGFRPGLLPCYVTEGVESIHRFQVL